MLEITKIKDELASLIKKGTRILYAAEWIENGSHYESHDKKTKDLLRKMAEEISDFKKEYHVWYAQAHRTVEVLAPERLEEFDAFYSGNKNIKNIKDFSYLTAGMTHFLQGITTTTYSGKQSYYGKFQSGLQQQIHILEAISTNIEDVLFNLKSSIYYGLYKTELDAAKELRKIQQLRAAGAIAGVVIEGHLKEILIKRGIPFKKKNPAISDYNEDLKEQKIIDVPMWRLIQRCGDIRNYCVHSKDREPTSDEIDDIIKAAEKILSEVA